jgi:hypothetical protein
MLLSNLLPISGIKCGFKLVLISLGLWIPSVSVSAQDPLASQESPQILTTDLKRRQTSNEVQLPVSWVIYDDDLIQEILINGKPVKFAKSQTVVINRLLNLKPGKNLISVTATDSEQNLRTRRYLVLYAKELGQAPESPLPHEEDHKKDIPKFSWKIVAGLKYENDSNPSQDIGIPVKIGDIEIQGVIDDSQQADTRISQNLLALLSYGTINAFIGVNQTGYSKSLYKKT